MVFEAVGPALHRQKSSIPSGRRRAGWLVCNLAPLAPPPVRSLQAPSVTKSRWLKYFVQILSSYQSSDCRTATWRSDGSGPTDFGLGLGGSQAFAPGPET